MACYISANRVGLPLLSFRRRGGEWEGGCGRMFARSCRIVDQGNDKETKVYISNLIDSRCSREVGRGIFQFVI